MDVNDELESAKSSLSSTAETPRKVSVDRHNAKVAIVDYQKALMKAVSLNVVTVENHRQLSVIVDETKAKAAQMDALLQSRHRDQEVRWQAEYERLQTEIGHLTPFDRKEHISF